MESWKGQKLLPRAEFHVGAHVSKFLRLQMLPTSVADRTNRYALLCGILDGSIGCVAPLDELTFWRLHLELYFVCETNSVYSQMSLLV